MQLALVIVAVLLGSVVLGILGSILTYERGPREALSIIAWRFFTKEGWSR